MATPVDTIAERVVQVSAVCPAASLITDAGSTKEAIVAAVDAGLAARRSGPRFVGSHPLAGDHRTGPEHARADLFEGRTVVITPTEHDAAGGGDGSQRLLAEPGRERDDDDAGQA